MQGLHSGGDIFQVVLSQRLETQTKARAFDIYPDVAGRQSKPFHVLLESWADMSRRQLARDHGEAARPANKAPASQSGRWRERGRAGRPNRKTRS